MDKVGKDGVITVEEGKSLDTEVEVVEGMQFDRGYLSPYFVTNAERHGSRARQALHPHLREEDLLHEGPPPHPREVAPQGPLLIIAEDVEGEALATLVVNKLRGTLKVAAVKAPGFGDRRKPCSKTSLSSPAANSSAKTSAKNSKTPPSKTSAPPTKSRSTKTTPPSSRALAPRPTSRAASPKSKPKIEDTTSDYDREKLQERLAKLSGGVAVIKSARPPKSK
jgi:chaperonin GroEL